MQMSALLTKMALFVIVILIGMFGARKKILTKDFKTPLTLPWESLALSC